MSNYLVTGGAGFIGSAIAKKLIDQGHQVTIIDNLTTGFHDNLPSGSHFINANLQDPNLYRKLTKQTYNQV